jgi:hypothetical protein
VEDLNFVSKLRSKKHSNCIHFLQRGRRRTYLQAITQRLAFATSICALNFQKTSFLAIIELTQTNFGVLRAGVSAVTAKMCMRAEIWSSVQKFIYDAVMLILEIMYKKSSRLIF